MITLAVGGKQQQISEIRKTLGEDNSAEKIKSGSGRVESPGWERMEGRSLVHIRCWEADTSTQHMFEGSQEGPLVGTAVQEATSLGSHLGQIIVSPRVKTSFTLTASESWRAVARHVC